MTKIIGIIFLLLYGALHLYVANNFVACLKSFTQLDFKLWIYAIIFVLMLISLATYLLPKINLHWLGTLGNFWLGILYCAVISFFAADLLHFLLHFLGSGLLDSVKIATYVKLTLLIVLLAVGLYGGRKIHITNYHETINKNSSLSGLKIAMISDLHLGYSNDDKRLAQIVKKINQAQPNIVLIPGDFFDSSFRSMQHPDKAAEILQTIKAPYGTYLSWGNHDAGETFQEMRSFIQNTNIHLLEDDSITFPDKFILTGRKDSQPIGEQGEKRRSLEQEIASLDHRLPIIVLDHQPSNIHEKAYKEVDLILSGHTHKGQLFPFNYVTNRLFTVDYGQYESPDHTKVIVTSGVGTWGPPMRVGTKCEIVLIDLVFH